MTFQILVLPSDLTPPPADFRLLVDALLAEADADWIDAPDDGDLRLSDGTEIGLFLDDQENVAAFVLEGTNETAFDLIYTLADRAAAFVAVGERACAAPPTDDVLPEFEAQLPTPDDLPNRQAFGDWMRVAMAAARPAPVSPPRPPRPSLLQRLSDSLFGKEI